jgi:hypothetical protein
VNGSDRVTILWADNAIQNTWLQVTVKADGNTGLASPDVFYFGNVIGESGNSGSTAMVTIADVNMAKALQGTAGITSPVDFNRNGQVAIADVNIAKAYQNGSIPLLVAPSVAAPGVAVETAALSLAAPREPAVATSAVVAAAARARAVPKAPVEHRIRFSHAAVANRYSMLVFPAARTEGSLAKARRRRRPAVLDR